MGYGTFQGEKKMGKEEAVGDLTVADWFLLVEAGTRFLEGATFCLSAE